MASPARVPTIPASRGGEDGLNRYLSEIKKFPILAPEEEFMLAKAWREQGDTDAAARLVNSHLRLVAKIAMGYRGYGLPVGEPVTRAGRTTWTWRAADPMASYLSTASVGDFVLTRDTGPHGLPIVNDRPNFGVTGGPAVEAFFRDSVIGGPGAFLIVAEDFNAFGDAVRRKMVQEIAGLAPSGPG